MRLVPPTLCLALLSTMWGCQGAFPWAGPARTSDVVLDFDNGTDQEALVGVLWECDELEWNDTGWGDGHGCHDGLTLAAQSTGSMTKEMEESSTSDVRISASLYACPHDESGYPLLIHVGIDASGHSCSNTFTCSDGRPVFSSSCESWGYSY